MYMILRIVFYIPRLAIEAMKLSQSIVNSIQTHTETICSVGCGVATGVTEVSTYPTIHFHFSACTHVHMYVYMQELAVTEVTKLCRMVLIDSNNKL